MPDERTHRGAHPQDAELFAESAWPVLRTAVEHYSWLLTREYAGPSALKLVGDRFALQHRQRLAVMRSAAADQALQGREQTRCCLAEIGAGTLLIDGFNVLTTIEAALSGGVILIGRDGNYRDLASMHGSYRKVEETIPAIRLVGTVLSSAKIQNVAWYLDQPVSNSGRLKTVLAEIARESGWNWRVEVVPSPDYVLKSTPGIAATADSGILDHCERWLPLARDVVTRCCPSAWMVDLSRTA